MATADSVVVELEARTAGYDAAINGSATKFDAAVSKVEKSAAQVEARVGKSFDSTAASANNMATKITEAAKRGSASQQILQSTIRRTSDQFAAGAPISTIFAEHVGAIAEAGELAGGSLGRFGTVLAGSWGIAIQAGVAIASVFATKLLEGGDAVSEETRKLEDNAKKAAAAEQAKRIFATTEAGIVDDVRNLTTELNKQNDALRTNAELANIRAKTDLQRLQDQRAAAAQQLADARVAAKATPIAGGGVAGTGTFISGQADQQVRDLQAKVDQLDKEIATAQSAVLRTRVPLAAEQAATAADPIKSVTKAYDDQIAVIRRNADAAAKQGRDISAAAYTAIRALEKQKAAAVDAAQAAEQARKSSTKGFNEIGRTINEAQARSIVQGIGGTVTSGYRSTEKQAQLYAKYKAGQGPLAATPGTSLHELGEAVDVAKTQNITLKKLVDAFRARGVNVTEALDEGDHYHIGFGKKGNADAQARKDEAARQKAIRNQTAYETAAAQASADIASARKDQVTDVSQLAQLARDQVEAETDKKFAAIDGAEKAGQYTKVQAENLRALALQTNALKIIAINADETAALSAQRLQALKADLGNQIDILQGAEALAERSDQRKAIELQLLDLKYQELRAEQQAVIDSQSASDAQKEIARARLDVLGTLQKQDTAGVDQRYRGSYDTYRKQVAGDFETVQESVDKIKVDALKGLEDTLVNSAKAALGLHGVLGNIVGDLIRIGIERRLIGPLADGLFGKAGGSSSGLFGSLLSGIVGAFGGGSDGGLGASVSSGASQSISNLIANGPHFGLASGGSFQVGGEPGLDRNLLSLNGKPVARVMRGEIVNVSRGERASGGSERHFHISVDARGSVNRDDFADRLSASILSKAAEMDIEAGKATLKRAPGYVQSATRFGTAKTF